MKPNTKLNPLTVNGNTIHDQAHEIWYNKMNWMQRLEVMNKVGEIKSTVKKFRACLNHIAENLSIYQ